MRLAIRELSVRYGRTLAVDSVSLELAAGEVLAILGPNGSGKSSLVRAMAGQVPFAGRVAVEPAGPARVGYMPQDVSSRAALTVLEAVLLGRLGRLGLRVLPDDLAMAGSILSELGIAALAGRYLGELSGGQRQLAFLAQALAAEPSVLLLDEPISALDIRHQLEVMETVRRLTRERALATAVVLHDLNIAARYADRIAVMKSGRLVASGRPEEVIGPALMEAVFGIQAVRMTGIEGCPAIVAIRPI